LVVGGVLLLKQFNFSFSLLDLELALWLIVAGACIWCQTQLAQTIMVYTGILGVGLAFLTDENLHFDVGGIMWPILIIAFGIWIIMRKKQTKPCITMPITGIKNTRQAHNYTGEKPCRF
jgi:hypothetical protein